MPRTFGQNLKDEREKRGVTQEELARRLGLKRQAQVSKYETGKMNLPEPQTIVDYANAIGCEPKALLRDVDTPYDLIRQGRYAPALPMLRHRQPPGLRAKKTHDRKLARRSA